VFISEFLDEFSFVENTDFLPGMDMQVYGRANHIVVCRDSIDGTIKGEAVIFCNNSGIFTLTSSVELLLKKAHEARVLLCADNCAISLFVWKTATF